MISVSVRLLLVWALCVIIGTLAPFDFWSGASVDAHALKVFQSGSHERDPIHFLLNLLFFMPLGALLHHEGRRRSRSVQQVVILAAAAGVLMSATLEYLQAFLPSRDSSLIDVLGNTAGAAMGVVVDRAWGATAEGCLDRLRSRVSLNALAGLTMGFLVLALMSSAALEARARLSDWSTEYPLLVGNEQTGDRPWRGRVFALAITDAATPPAVVRRFSAGEPIELPGSWIALFDFNGSPPYRDAADSLPDLAWTAGANESGDGGVTMTGRRWLQSTGPASGIAHRIGETNAFTLRLSCATDGPSQEGPARIVSNSISPFLRNFTLGQERGDLVVRLRTPQTGRNGTPPETVVPGVFSAGQLRDILVTYDGATLTAAVAQMGQIVHTEFTPATALALLVGPMISYDVPAENFPLCNLAYLSILFLPAGVLVCLLGRTSRDRLLISVVYLIAAAALLEPTLVTASGRAFDWRNVALTTGVGSAVLSGVGIIFWQGDRAYDSRPTARVEAGIWS